MKKSVLWITLVLQKEIFHRTFFQCSPNFPLFFSVEKNWEGGVFERSLERKIPSQRFPCFYFHFSILRLANMLHSVLSLPEVKKYLTIISQRSNPNKTFRQWKGRGKFCQFDLTVAEPPSSPHANPDHSLSPWKSIPGRPAGFHFILCMYLHCL